MILNNLVLIKAINISALKIFLITTLADEKKFSRHFSNFPVIKKKIKFILIYFDLYVNFSIIIKLATRFRRLPYFELLILIRSAFFIHKIPHNLYHINHPKIVMPDIFWPDGFSENIKYF